jgi:hypothetical protein
MPGRVDWHDIQYSENIKRRGRKMNRDMIVYLAVISRVLLQARIDDYQGQPGIFRLGGKRQS